MNCAINNGLFFADSYAVIEILKGNEIYRPYQTAQLVTTELRRMLMHSS
jgi:hypothetical protein